MDVVGRVEQELSEQFPDLAQRREVAECACRAVVHALTAEACQADRREVMEGLIPPMRVATTANLLRDVARQIAHPE